jgi:hypothetical protein
MSASERDFLFAFVKVEKREVLSEAPDRRVLSRHCPDSGGWANGKPIGGAENGQNCNLLGQVRFDRTGSLELRPRRVLVFSRIDTSSTLFRGIPKGPERCHGLCVFCCYTNIPCSLELSYDTFTHSLI